MEILARNGLNLLKLGAFAVISVFSNKVFKEAASQALNGAIQSYREVKTRAQ